MALSGGPKRHSTDYQRSVLAIYRASRQERRPFTVSSVNIEADFVQYVTPNVTSSQMDILSNVLQPEKVDKSAVVVSDSKLDKNTYKWQSWTNTANPVNQIGFGSSIKFPKESKPTKPVQTAESLGLLTKNEFRRLTRQLNDGSWNVSNRFRGLAFNRFKGVADDDHKSSGNQSGACLYRSQLAASSKIFNTNRQIWQPYANHKEPTYDRCRPVTHTTEDSRGNRYRERPSRRVVTSASSTRRRPKSSPVIHSRHARDVAWGDYDMLNAQVISDFRGDNDDSLESKFGEKLTIISKDRKGEHHSVEIRPHLAVSDQMLSDSSTSGIVSGDSDTGDDATEDNPPDKQQLVENVQLNDKLDDYDNEGDESDDERNSEPPTPRDDNSHKIPQTNWGLKPDVLEDEDGLGDGRDRSRYDFDANNNEQPRYEFKDAFSPALMSLDLKAIADQDAMLEIRPKVNQTESKLILRCLELEKLQLATRRAEDSRYSRTRLYSRQRVSSSNLSRSRCQSAKVSKNVSQCSPDCVQPACVGDCPGKYSAGNIPCKFCKEKNCAGTCGPTPYSNHIRKTSGNDDVPVTNTKPPRPKSCTSCAKDARTRAINTHQSTLGRPKSSHSTYSQAKKTVRQSYNLQQSTQILDGEKLNSSGYLPRPMSSPAGFGRGYANRHLRRGRDSISPHKSYYSQRRISLTMNTVRPLSKASSKKKK